MKTLTLQDVCEVIMGQAPAGATYNTTGDGVGLIAGAGDFSNGLLTPKKFTNRPTKLSTHADIVLSIRASIGDKVWADGEYCLGRGVAALRAGPNIDAKFLWHWITITTPILKSKAKGATFLQVGRMDIGELPITLPPLDEQRRIAAILDNADGLRAKRRQALANLDALIGSVFNDMFGDPPSLQADARTTVGDVTNILVPSRDKPRSFDGDIPWVTLPDLTGLYIDQAKQNVSPTEAKTAKNKMIPSGAVLLSCAATVGKTAIARTQIYANQQFYGLVPNTSRVLPTYLAVYLSMLGPRYFAGLGGSFTISFFSKEKAQSIKIPIPAIGDQFSFEERVNAIVKLKARYQDQLVAFDALFSSLQHRALKGGL